MISLFSMNEFNSDLFLWKIKTTTDKVTICSPIVQPSIILSHLLSPVYSYLLYRLPMAKGLNIILLSLIFQLAAQLSGTPAWTTNPNLNAGTHETTQDRRLPSILNPLRLGCLPTPPCLNSKTTNRQASPQFQG